MKPILYYFPANNTPHLALMPQDHPLYNIQTGHGVKKCNTSQGPDGGAGTVVWFLPGPDAELPQGVNMGYFPDQQTWREGPGYWCGYFTAHKPGPDDLIRQSVIEGYYCTLADGQKWIIPLARYVEGNSAFPRQIAWGPNGEIVEEPLPRYQHLCQIAQEAFNIYVEQGDLPREKKYYDTIAEALAVNYVIDKTAISALGLFTTQNIGLAMSLLFDSPRIAAWLDEKKTLDMTVNGSDTPDGKQGNTAT